MDFRLDPHTRAGLRQFGRRRRRLILLRGLSALAVSLAGSALLLVAVDAFVLLPDRLRWALSLAAYGVSLLLGWFTCMRLLVRLPSERALARLVELSEPSLREELVSAVELGAPDADPRYDSPLFRALLQRSVARRMSGLNMGQLLPWRLVRGWLLAASAVLAVCAVLAALPRLELPRRMARVLLPAANLARVSRVQVHVLRPAPPDAVVPQGEPVAVLIELSGPDTPRAVLETAVPGKPRQRIGMQPQGPRRHAAMLRVGRESMAWRVLAGDAVTRYFHLIARPRPYVKQFQKTYHYPDYAGLAPASVVETQGDLKALEGTQARVVIRADQPVSRGRLVLEVNGQTTPLEMEPTGDGRLAANVPMGKSGTYEVQLVAAETGFDSRFSPRYPIIAEPDLPPKVDITQPAGPLFLPPDEIVRLAAEAEDDLPLAGLQQCLQVNGGSWQAVEVPIEAGRLVRVDRDWDLLELKLKEGDRVLTKMAAADRKGQRSESPALQVTIAPRGIETERHVVLGAKRRAAEAVQHLSRTAEKLVQDARGAIEQLLAAERSEAERRLATVNALQAAHQLAGETQRTVQVLTETIRLMPAGSDAHDLALAALAIVPLQFRTPRALTCQLHESERAGEISAGRRHLEEARATMQRAAGLAQQTAQWLQTMYHADALAAALEDACDLIAVAQRSTPLADRLPEEEPLAWRMLARRQAFVLQHASLLESTVRSLSERLGNHDRLAATLAAMAAVRRKMEPAIAAEPPPKQLAEFARQLTQELHNARRELKPPFVDSAKNLALARPQFSGSAVGWHARLLRQLAAGVQLWEQARRGGRDLTEPAAARQLEAAEWPAVIETIRGRAAVEEQRPDADREYVSDLDSVAVVLKSMQMQASAWPPPSPGSAPLASGPSAAIAQLAEAAAMLEAAHHAAELLSAVRRLEQREKWSSASAAAHTQHGREWDFVADRLEPIADVLLEEVRTRPAEEAAALLRKLAREPCTADVNQEMERRRRQSVVPAPILDRLAKVERDLEQVLSLLRPPADAAREVLRRWSPSPAERMQQLAEETRRQEEHTRQNAEQATAGDPLRTQAAARQEQAEHEQLAAELQQVLDTLRRLASLENPLDPQQELARDVAAASAMIGRPSGRIEGALRRAVESSTAPDQASHLADAAAQQRQLADALDQLARHFQAALAGHDVRASREELRRAESESGLAQRFEQWQQQARQLAEMSAMTPLQLLEWLERELKQNRPMQRELDRITRQALEEAQRDLSESARRQREIADELERTDADVALASEPVLEELRRIARDARDLAGNELETAGEQARRLGASAANEPLAQSRGLLLEAADQADQAADRELSPSGRSRRAAGLAETLDNSAQRLDQAAAEFRRMGRQASAKRQAREQLAADAEQARQRAREAAQQASQAEQQLHKSQARRQKARRDAEAAQSAAREAARRAGRERPAGRLAEEVRRAQQQADQAQGETRAADQSLQESQLAEQRARQSARAARQQAENAERRLRNAPAPTAAETQREAGLIAAGTRAEDAAAEARELAHRARKIGRSMSELARQAQPPPQAMQGAAEEQTAIAEDVRQAARDLSRAARHEKRLENPLAGQAIARVAEETSAVAEDRLPEAVRAVAAAANAAAARPPLEVAASQLDAQAERIGQLLNPSAAPAPPSPRSAAPNAASPPAGEQPSAGQPGETPSLHSAPPAMPPRTSTDGPPALLNEPETARWLARTLDSLDRSLFAAPAAGTPGVDMASASGAPPNGMSNGQMPGEATEALAAAASAQAAAARAARADAATLAGPGGMPGQTPMSMAESQTGRGAAVRAAPLAPGPLPAALPPDHRDWGRLPPRLAQDLVEGRREPVSEEYRRMVETYFRVIAETAGGVRKP